MRVRVDGQFLVREADNGQLAYAEITAPNSGLDTALPAGDHVIELDQIWLTSDPVTVTEGSTDVHQAIPTWMVAWGERGATEYLAVDPLVSDGDIDTVEIAAANRTDRTVILERCFRTASGPTAPNVWDCTRSYTVEPGRISPPTSSRPGTRWSASSSAPRSRCRRREASTWSATT
jgi:hypothetical protein